MPALRRTYRQVRSMTQNGVKEKALEAESREWPYGISALSLLGFGRPYIACTARGVLCSQKE